MLMVIKYDDDSDPNGDDVNYDACDDDDDNGDGDVDGSEDIGEDKNCNLVILWRQRMRARIRLEYKCNANFIST
jgi:hypothetical protein